MRGGLLYLPDLDLYLAKAMTGPRFQLAAEFALHLVQQVGGRGGRGAGRPASCGQPLRS